MASALSTVTLSFVASRWGRPRSKYFMSSSRKGSISCKCRKFIKTAGWRLSYLWEWEISIQTFSLIYLHITRVISSPAPNNILKSWESSFHTDTPRVLLWVIVTSYTTNKNNIGYSTPYFDWFNTFELVGSCNPSNTQSVYCKSKFCPFHMTE